MQNHETFIDSQLIFTYSNQLIEYFFVKLMKRVWPRKNNIKSFMLFSRGHSCTYVVLSGHYFGIQKIIFVKTKPIAPILCQIKKHTLKSQKKAGQGKTT